MSFEEVGSLEKLRRLVSISPEFKSISLLATPDHESDYAASINIKEEMGYWVNEQAVNLPWPKTIEAYLEHSLFPHQMVVKYKPKHGEYYRSGIVWKRKPDGDKYGVAFAARVINACYKHDVSHVFALGYSMSGAVRPLHNFLILYWAHKQMEKPILRKSDLTRLRSGKRRLLTQTVVEHGIEDLRREGLIGVEGKDEPPETEIKTEFKIGGVTIDASYIELTKRGVWLTEKGRRYWKDKDGIGIPTVELIENPNTLDDYREPYERMLVDDNFRINACTAAAMSHRENMRFGREVKFHDIVYAALTNNPQMPNEIKEKTGLRSKTVTGALYRLEKKKHAKHTDDGWTKA